MTTKEEMIKINKAENPTLRIGNDTDGYTELIGADYDAVIEEWATNRLTKETAILNKTTAKEALFNKLGITEEEATLLLS